VGEPTVILVFAAAVITALATGLGAVPLLATRLSSARGLAIGNAVAAGLMLAACFVLIFEGYEFSPGRTLAGIAAGVAGIIAADRFIKRHDSLSIADIRGADARKIVLIVGIMAAHSAAEGVGVGVAFAGGEVLGQFITLTIALHNVPQGLAVCLIMVPRGASVISAAGWAIATSLPQPLLAVPAFLFVLTFKPWLPFGLGLAAGAMIWVIVAELLPDALEGETPQLVGTIVTLAFAAMLAVTLLF
jgi:zinc transporter, ZIP family